MRHRDSHQALILATFLALAAIWPVAAWAQAGNKWAVIIGVSKFEKLEAAQQLEFADKDAEAFAKFIQSPRGREFPKDNVKVLLNQDATKEKLTSLLASWLKRSAKSEDMVYIYIATHGMVDKEEPRRTYLLTSEADPEDLYISSMSMKDLSDIITNRLSKAGRIVLFADACRSGKLGGGIGRDIQEGTGKNQELVGLLASRAREFSEESKSYCNGHGAFTCYLLKGLNGAADEDKDSTVTAGELLKYVRDQVAKATKDRQTPQEFGEFDAKLPMSFSDKPGADLGFTELAPSPWQRLSMLFASLSPWDSPLVTLALERARMHFAPAFEAPFAAPLLQGGRLPSQALQNDWDRYQQLAQSNAPTSAKEDARDELAVKLESEGKKVLLTYLRGDASPLSAQDYQSGAEYFSRAALLNPDEPALKAKARFCSGRAALLENRLPEAEAALRESVTIDPDGAYSHNALGICYTRLRRPTEAIREFQTAFDRAPRWAYPHFNLAFTYIQMQRYREAEQEYKAAIERGPNYAYLYQTLGTLYMNQLNRQDDAEKSFKKAIDLDPRDALAYNQLGGLYEKRGDLRLADTNYRKAFEVQPKNTVARLNLARLLIERNRKEEAEEVYGGVIQQDPTNFAAHLGLGKLLVDRGKLDDAETELTMAAVTNSNDVGVLESLGNLHVKQKRFEEAIREYRQALQLATDAADRSRIDKSLKAAEKK